MKVENSELGRIQWFIIGGGPEMQKRGPRAAQLLDTTLGCSVLQAGRLPPLVKLVGVRDCDQHTSGGESRVKSVCVACSVAQSSPTL